MGAGDDNLSAYENNRVYLNVDGKRFLDCSFGSGCDIDSDSRSVVAADFNRDGAADLLVGSVGGGPIRLFANQFPDKHHSIRLNLAGTKSNRTGIGSRVVVTAAGRKIVRDLFPANGCLGQGPAEMLVGVGNADRIDQLEIRWPNGLQQTLTDLPVDGVLMINEGNDNFGFTAFASAGNAAPHLQKFTAIVQPRWGAAATSSLEPGEPVLGLAARSFARAYPVRYLQSHHLCHDEVAGVPVLISFSPHANCGTAYQRRLADQNRKLTLTFEVAGMLQAAGYAVLRDTQTQSLWNPLTGQCVKGPLRGTTLKRVPLFCTTWAHWQQLSTTSEVLLPEGDVSYPPLPTDNSNSGSKYVKGISDAMPANAVGVGIRSPKQQLFVPLDQLAQFRGNFIVGKLDNREIVVFCDVEGRAASCFYTESTDSQDVEFSREKSGGGRFVSTDGSVYDMLGRCQSGPSAGSRLAAVADTSVIRWYAWNATFPNSLVVKKSN